MILTDSDCDGIHISSLIQNLFHNLFPSLLERKKPYITSMQTPIVRVFLDKKQLLFYDEREYKKYVTDFKLKNPNQKINNKYYKGSSCTCCVEASLRCRTCLLTSLRATLASFMPRWSRHTDSASMHTLSML